MTKENPVVFVTGATGLVGSHLLYWLAKEGRQIYALKREQSCIEETLAVFQQYAGGNEYWSRVEWVTGNVLEQEALETYIKSADYIYHCAAVVSFSGSDKSILSETNLKGTGNIAALCLKHGKRLCHVSSIAALGDVENPEELINEETPDIKGRAHSEYSHSKGNSEKIVWQYIAKGLNAVIVCPSIILGAGLWERSSAKLFTTAAKGIPFYTGGGMGYVDVRDVCKLMIRLNENSYVRGERYILNGGNYSYCELFTTIARAGGKRPPWFYLRPWMTGIIWRLLAAISKITGKKPAFTRETARTSHCWARFANAKISALYPDYSFYTLSETIRWVWSVYNRS